MMGAVPMLRKIAMVGILAGGSASFPILYEMNPGAIERWYSSVDADEPSEPASDAARQVTTVSAPAPPASTKNLLGRKVLVRADPRGHYVADVKLNGRGVEALIDTGATVVAINRSMARRIGLSLSEADFKHQVQTANGSARAASATIDRIQIGKISVENIQAAVLEDKALDGVLVGMSFLNRLSKFQVEGGALVMQQ